MGLNTTGTGNSAFRSQRAGVQRDGRPELRVWKATRSPTARANSNAASRRRPQQRHHRFRELRLWRNSTLWEHDRIASTRLRHRRARQPRRGPPTSPSERRPQHLTTGSNNIYHRERRNGPGTTRSASARTRPSTAAFMSGSPGQSSGGGGVACLSALAQTRRYGVLAPVQGRHRGHGCGERSAPAAAAGGVPLPARVRRRHADAAVRTGAEEWRRWRPSSWSSTRNGEARDRALSLRDAML